MVYGHLIAGQVIPHGKLIAWT